MAKLNLYEVRYRTSKPSIRGEFHGHVLASTEAKARETVLCFDTDAWEIEVTETPRTQGIFRVMPSELALENGPNTKEVA